MLIQERIRKILLLIIVGGFWWVQENTGMSNPLFRSTYAYDANGCRISKTEQIRMDATTPLKVMETCYIYDSMERLTKESLNGAVTSYGYDLAGNRITKSTDGRTIMMQKATGIPLSLIHI